ncbi:TetR/AcrR family transcriptional regulator [Thalassococcus sp. S3]|uniref:TetR/AcrR family transcriptional regulator n=1 Tax=Thalassococcus sp. S3 TaxID=2017482 RepID=UPI0013EE4292|nr:TetR/AcrR family transcriptional regulator [Thalassococcus sp. S3]
MPSIRPSTHAAILEAAFQVFNDMPGASLAVIAERAGVGRATLHRHFASREDLLLAMAKAAHAELTAAVDAAVADAQSYTEGLRLAMAAIIPLAERHMFLASQTLDHHPEMAEAEARDRLDLISDIDKAKSEGLLDPNLPSSWIAESYDALIYAGWAVVHRQEATPRQAADMAWRSFLKGCQI